MKRTRESITLAAASSAALRRSDARGIAVALAVAAARAMAKEMMMRPKGKRTMAKPRVIWASKGVGAHKGIRP